MRLVYFIENKDNSGQMYVVNIGQSHSGYLKRSF